MGQGGGVLKPQVIAEITSQTNFTESEAKDLYRLFLEEAATNGKTCYNLTKPNFIRFFASSFPGVDCERIATRVFHFYDTDDTCDCDFSEFLKGLNVQLTTDQDQLVLNAFQYVDIKKKGVITFEDTVDAIQSIYDLKAGLLPIEEIVEPNQYAERIFVRAGRKEQGTMNLSLFKNVVRSSSTAQSLVDAINIAACRPYWDRMHVTGSIGRKRAATVIVRKSSSAAAASANIPMRKFTI